MFILSCSICPRETFTSTSKSRTSSFLKPVSEICWVRSLLLFSFCIGKVSSTGNSSLKISCWRMKDTSNLQIMVSLKCWLRLISRKEFRPFLAPWNTWLHRSSMVLLINVRTFGLWELWCTKWNLNKICFKTKDRPNTVSKTTNRCLRTTLLTRR